MHGAATKISEDSCSGCLISGDVVLSPQPARGWIGLRNSHKVAVGFFFYLEISSLSYAIKQLYHLDSSVKIVTGLKAGCPRYCGMLLAREGVLHIFQWFQTGSGTHPQCWGWGGEGFYSGREAATA